LQLGEERRCSDRSREELEMHAIVVHVDIEDVGEAAKGLEEMVLPMMKSAPGFKAAYYVAVDETHGVSVEVFDTEEQARAAAPPPDAEAPGVRLAKIEFGPVIASA
jgi:hypothetical protein